MGKAADAIDHVTHQEEYYEEALKIIKERHGSDEVQELQAAADLETF